MEFDQLLKRINELAHKSKTSQLTDIEKIEQKELRKEYIKIFRQNMKNRLDNITVVDKKDLN
ncbi:MAG: DUF896 family protein [Fusobacteriia bacterium 4572_132]|nr:MAG: DUF896 family protein [Fusobacteriia bacterium 4572_132]